MLRGIVAALAGFCLWSIGSSAFGQPSFQGLGPIPGGSIGTYPAAVSADGSVVVGRAMMGDGRPQAFRWTQVEGMVGLGYLPGGVDSVASGISANGAIIVGSSAVNCNTRAFRWTAEEGMVTLPLLGGSTGGATAITADGSVIVGWAREGMTGYSVAVLWTADGQVIPLGGLPGYSSGSTAAAVSADGSVVVGRCFSSEWQLGNQAFRWTAQTGMVGLGDLPGGDFFSISTAVSADGSVVVGYSLAASGWQAFRWTPAEGMVALGDLPGGDIYSLATGLTADGSVIVGAGRLQGSYPYFDQPFIWEAINGMRDFQGFLVNDLSLDLTACGYSWNLSGATAISADGSTIVGYGLNPVAVATGMVDNEEGWIARISLPPVAGDIDGDGDADMDDVNVFVKVLLGLDTDLYHVAASDINLSGTADGRDIQPFVNLLLTP